jgi:D-alanyl-D-alanine carboxypeptidase/D-alanyl-D-alanine-endopeptidase (penicillin-binding protein 4)
MNKKSWFFLLFMAYGSLSAAQHAGIQRAVQQFTADPALKHAGVGISVVEIQTNQMAASHQPNLSLVPASSLKVVTTSTAMAVLGASYRFLTQLEIGGTVQGKVLQGHVYVTGFGDPTLGSPTMPGAMPMEALMAKLRETLLNKGIRTVNGYVVGDGTWFPADAAGGGWAWADLGNYYASGAWGLNLHENYYFLRFQRSASVGATPRIALIEPHVPGLEFFNEVKQAAPQTGDNAYIFGAPFTGLRYVRGTIPAGAGQFTIKGSLPDPPYFLAYHLRQALVNAGISCAKGPESMLQLQRQGHQKPAGVQVLYRHYSPALKEIIREAHYESNNLYCEALPRTLGKKQKKEGSAEMGVQALREFWEQRGLSFSGCHLEDGSGLSAGNAVTARFFTDLLGKIGRDPKWFPTFSSTLATAGQSGSLKDKFKGTAAEGRLLAKSGSLSRVRSYVGYAKNKKGQWFAFAILVNNYEGSGTTIRQKMEKLMLAFCAS